MNKKIKNLKKVKKHQKTVNPKILIITSILLAVLLTGALAFDQLYERVVLTIAGDKYHMNDLSYYFYTVEAKHDYYNQMFGGTYWDMSYNENTNATMRDAAKQEAVDASLSTEILYREAVSEGYTLTEEETGKIKTDVTALLETELSEAVVEKNDFTEEYLTKILGKSTLVGRYRQDKIDALDIDDEGIKAGIDYAAYKQYDIEYLFISTQKSDEEGNSVAMSAEEKTVAFDKINAVYETAKTTKDWSTLIPEDEKVLTYKKDNFLASGTKFSEAFEAIMMPMENDSISELYEDEKGYYIVRMLNNNSSESYDNAVEQAITEEEDKGFTAIYDEVIKKYDYKINENNVRSLRMGELTLAN